MRVGPLGLFTQFSTDMIIVKEEKTRECQIYKKLHDVSNGLKESLRTKPANQIKDEYFNFLEPLAEVSHADFAVSSDQIDWSIYDIVISINISVPTLIVKKYPSVLWCYMMGEAGWSSPEPDFGYDVCLTQNTTGAVASGLGNIEFPYTFLGDHCLQNLLESHYAPVRNKNGIYAEINCTEDRPVVKVPQLEIFAQDGFEIRVHSQNVMENLKRILNSKYFVKWGGRTIRGNSVIEAISCGTLVLMNPKEVIHSQLLPPETWVTSFEQLRELVYKLESSKVLYDELLIKQRSLLNQFVFMAPWESLKNALNEKRKGKFNSKLSLSKKIKYQIKKWVLY